jgi:RepB DNA-primase from phage plasmid/Primase C terminal 2 (PriCT-2)
MNFLFDREMADAFLNLLAPNELSFTFQTFDDSKLGREKLQSIRHGTLKQHWGALEALSTSGAGIFVTVNQTDFNGRKAHNIREVRALFVDLDGAPLDNAMRLGLVPSIVVRSSPSRHHVYWRVEGLSLDEFPSLQKRLAALTGGDKTVCDLPRVMRLPGFAHRKGHPSLTALGRLPEAPKQPYQREKFLTALAEAERRHGISSNAHPATEVRSRVGGADAGRAYSPEEEKKLRNALAVTPADKRDDWFKVGGALSATGWACARAIWDEWSKKSAKFNEADQEKTWASFGREYHGPIVSIATIYALERRTFN